MFASKVALTSYADLTDTYNKVAQLLTELLEDNRKNKIHLNKSQLDAIQASTTDEILNTIKICDKVWEDINISDQVHIYIVMYALHLSMNGEAFYVTASLLNAFRNSLSETNYSLYEIHNEYTKDHEGSPVFMNWVYDRLKNGNKESLPKSHILSNSIPEVTREEKINILIAKKWMSNHIDGIPIYMDIDNPFDLEFFRLVIETIQQVFDEEWDPKYILSDDKSKLKESIHDFFSANKKGFRYYVMPKTKEQRGFTYAIRLLLYISGYNITELKSDCDEELITELNKFREEIHENDDSWVHEDGILTIQEIEVLFMHVFDCTYLK